MSLQFPPAQMIQGASGRNVMYIVYGVGVDESEVRPVVRRLSALRGIQAQALRGSVDATGPRVVVIELTIQQSANVEAAMALVKRLARPALPIAIRTLGFGLLICRCGYLSSKIDNLAFYRGLGPDDDEAFRLRFYAAIKDVPVAKLVSADPRPPYGQLADGIEAVLAGLGARATEVLIVPRRDTRPCTHSR